VVVELPNALLELPNALVELPKALFVLVVFDPKALVEEPNALVDAVVAEGVPNAGVAVLLPKTPPPPNSSFCGVPNPVVVVAGLLLEAVLSNTLVAVGLDPNPGVAAFAFRKFLYSAWGVMLYFLHTLM